MTAHASSSPPPCSPTPALPDRFALIFPIARTVLADDQAPIGNSPVIELRIELDLFSNHTAIQLADPSSNTHRILRTDAQHAGIVRSTHGWLHLDAPGIATCSIMQNNDHDPVLVYATTPLLRELGAGGGRYGAPTIRLDG